MKKNDSRRLLLLFVFFSILLFRAEWARGQTSFDSFADGNFTASPVWGGETASWTIVANSDAAAGATGSNTLRLNSPAVAATDYLSSQITTSWGTSQEWGFWVGRRAQAFTGANQFYFWLYANESTLDNLTVDGYRIAIGDDTGNDDIRLEYIVNGVVSATVIATSATPITNGLTDIGLLIRVTRSSTGVWNIYTSTVPTANSTGAIATDIPNAANTPVSQGTATNNSLVPAANGYLGVAALHTSGAPGIVAVELDQIYFTPCEDPTITTIGTVAPVCFNASAQTTTLDYTATTNTPTAYSIDWATLADQASTPFSFVAGGGTITGITIPAGTPAATYTGTMTLTNSCGSATQAVSVTVNATPAPTISGTTSVCVGANTTLTPSITGGEWSSGTPANASIDASTGVVLGLAVGTSVMTYTVTVTGCVGTTTSTVTVNPLPTLTVANPATVCTPSTVDITTAAVQTTNTGTTTKYYNGYALALAGGASNVSTPSAIASAGTYYIRSELATGCYVIQPVTVTINQSPSFAPLVTQPTCLTNGSITFAALSPGTYTYSYTINGGSSTAVSPSGGNVTISVPMGMQAASTYAVTATRTDITPNCSYTVSKNIAAITFCITPTVQVADPCTCNNNQTTDGSKTGTFNETVVVNGSGPGQTWTVATIAPLVAGTAPTLAVNTVLSAVINSGSNGIDDDGDGSTDEPDEAYIYSVSFVHTDDAGYTATIEGPAALGTGGNQTLNIANRCQYPEIIFGANPAASYCVASGAMPSVALSVTEANSMAGTATFSGTGVSGTTFAPTGGGTYTITAVYQSTAGTGKGGTVGTPATPANACYTTESKTTTVTDSRCGTFPQ